MGVVSQILSLLLNPSATGDADDTVPGEELCNKVLPPALEATARVCL
jgi:hypothetical protein